MPMLTAVITARDDAKELGRAISSVSFADEVLVVDAGTTGEAERVCRPVGARILKGAAPGIEPPMRWSVGQATHDWVLCIGADEAVTPELAAAVRALLASGEPTYPAYRARDVNVFMGRPLSRGRQSGRSTLRLFDRRRIRWSGVRIPEPDPSVGKNDLLPGMIRHFEMGDIASAMDAMNTRSSVAAIWPGLNGVARGGLAILLAAVLRFFRAFVARGNYRNGFPGLAWSFIEAVGAATTLMKARELVARSDSLHRGDGTGEPIPRFENGEPHAER